MEMRLSPAAQVKSIIINYLRGVCGDFSLPIESTMIRGMLDASGELKQAWGILVACEDLGDHAGNTNRILVDVRPSITVYTHINEDAEGTLAESLATEVQFYITSCNYAELEGWECNWVGNWTISDMAMDGSYRQITLEATLPLSRT